MKHNLWLLAIVPLALYGCAPEPDTEDEVAEKDMRAMDKGPDEHVVWKPDEIEWEDGPASLEEGAQYAMLEGDMTESGVFTLRLKFPDGFHIAPHTHPNVERVTVISGTFLLGAGDEADKDEAMELETGSYTSMAPGMEHYAYAEGETVIQITTIGPWEIDYLDPDDDPRKD